jgi:hypothetical protein
MKTSELKKWLDENEWEYVELNDFIIVDNDMKIYKIIDSIDIPAVSFGKDSDFEKLLLKVLEYTNTPLNEREDEKKYYFEFGSCLDRIEKQRYLGVDVDDGVFYFDKEHTNNFNFKFVFTQQEIDNFPAEIKGAIECGFLRKVEVE